MINFNPLELAVLNIEQFCGSYKVLTFVVFLFDDLLPWMGNAMAGYRLAYPQARSWLVSAGIGLSPYDNSECLTASLIFSKRRNTDKITVNPIDDPITRVLNCIAVRISKRTGPAVE